MLQGLVQHFVYMLLLCNRCYLIGQNEIDFLIKYLSPVCYIHSPVHYDDGTFSVMVEDAEGWNGTSDIFFDAEGNVIEK